MGATRGRFSTSGTKFEPSEKVKNPHHGDHPKVLDDHLMALLQAFQHCLRLGSMGRCGDGIQPCYLRENRDKEIINRRTN